MKPGEIVEVAIWLNGEETDEQIAHWKTVQVPALLEQTEKQFGVLIRNIEFSTKYPGEDRVPPVPDHISGINVRLLVCEAQVFSAPPKIEVASGFVHDLTKDDRNRLREITRRAYAKTHPGQWLNNKQVDSIINAMGPEAALKTLDGKLH